MNAPISGKYIFDALNGKNVIVLATNTRVIKGITRGIFRAAKEVDAAVIIEIARSECNMSGGYTGTTPSTFAQLTIEAAEAVGHDIWALHADHIGVKIGDRKDIETTKKLIESQIKAGFTSFAIDASHLFNFDGLTVEDELAPNIEATVELARHIRKKYGADDFGLEVEVGEIGRRNDAGMILTTPDEAVTFIRSLNERGIYPQVLAIANGSTHGNVYGPTGESVEQISIDIGRTNAIASQLESNGLSVKIAQHGITGTPLSLIETHFPHGNIIKGNVGTFWQNLYHDELKRHNPGLFRKLWDWTVETYGGRMKAENIMNHRQLFGKYGKFSTREFFSEIYDMDQTLLDALEIRAHDEALRFFGAFRGQNTAKLVRSHLQKLG